MHQLLLYRKVKVFWVFFFRNVCKKGWKAWFFYCVSKNLKNGRRGSPFLIGPHSRSLILMISLFLSESSNEFLVSLVSRATRQQYRRKCWCFNQPKICYPVMWRPLRLAFHQSILIFSLFASLFSPKNDLHFGREIITTNTIS